MLSIYQVTDKNCTLHYQNARIVKHTLDSSSFIFVKFKQMKFMYQLPFVHLIFMNKQCFQNIVIIINQVSRSRLCEGHSSRSFVKYKKPANSLSFLLLRLQFKVRGKIVLASQCFYVLFLNGRCFKHTKIEWPTQ